MEPLAEIGIDEYLNTCRRCMERIDRNERMPIDD
jgi:hypothetical protein